MSDVSPDSLAAATADLVNEARAQAVTMTQGDLANTLEFNNLLGIARYARTLDTVNRVTLLKTLQRLKDNKGYRSLTIPGPDGQPYHPKNFGNVCEALGLSLSKVNMDLLNLAAFGEEMLQAQSRLGIGYRELRQLRAGLDTLPPEEREDVQAMIKAAAESGDKEEMLAALDEANARNKALADKLKAVKADLEQTHKVLSDKGARLDEAEIQLRRATHPATPDEAAKKLSQKRQILRSDLDDRCTDIIGKMTALCSQIAVVLREDTQGADTGAEPVLDAVTADYVTRRISLMCQDIRGVLLDFGIEVDFAAEMAADEITPDADVIDVTLDGDAE